MGCGLPRELVTRPMMGIQLGVGKVCEKFANLWDNSRSFSALKSITKAVA